MKITSLQFFSLPLDKTYKNVIMHKYNAATANAFNTNLKNMLASKYAYTLVNTPNSPGVNRTQNKIEFNITSDYSTIRNRNYVVITDKSSKIYFYFIDSVEELNSDSLLHIVASWDVWMNNLYYLNKQDYDVLTERRTTKDFEFDSANETFKVYSKKICTNDGDIAARKKNFTLQSENYEILWLRISVDPELDKDTKLLLVESDNQYEVPRNNKLVGGPCYYFYTPLMRFHKGLLYGQDLRNERFIFSADSSLEISQSESIDAISIAFSDMDPTWVLKADLTFNAPFDCIYYNTETVIKCSAFGNPRRWRINETSHTRLANGIYCYSNDNNYEQIDTIGANDLVEYDSYINRDVVKENLGNFLSYIKGKDFDNVRLLPNINEHLDDLKIFKYWVNRYMYPYLKVKINSKGNSIDIVPNHAIFSCNIYTKISGEGIILSHQTIDYNGDVIETNLDTMKAMQSNESLPLTKSAYEAYIQYNANSIAVKQSLAALGSIIGVASTFAGIPAYAGILGGAEMAKIGIALAGGAYATQGIGSAISAASGYFETNAKINDSKNQASILSNSNFSASLDVFKSDRVFISVEMPSSADDETLAIAKSVRKFGNCINCYHPLLARVKEKFEYIKTVDCNISWIPNIEDRAIINQIFNSGVHMWYSDNLQYDEQMNFYYYINLDNDIERI